MRAVPCREVVKRRFSEWKVIGVDGACSVGFSFACAAHCGSAQARRRGRMSYSNGSMEPCAPRDAQNRQRVRVGWTDFFVVSARHVNYRHFVR